MYKFNGKAFKASEQLETGVVAVNTPVVATAETPLAELNKQVTVEKGVQLELKIISI